MYSIKEVTEIACLYVSVEKDRGKKHYTGRRYQYNLLAGSVDNL
jgi:hypothetical protein